MKKIAVNREAKVVQLETDLGATLNVNTIISAPQLIQLLQKEGDGELRWLIGEDGKWWVWKSSEMYHYTTIQKLGYETAITGYVISSGGAANPASMSVFWYNQITEMVNYSKRGTADPLSNNTFKRVLSNPAITITEGRAPEYNMHTLKPEEVGKEPSELVRTGPERAEY